MRYPLIFLGVLASLAVSDLDPKCDPKTYEPKPYDGETTTDMETIKKLDNYLNEGRCVIMSDGTEQSIKEQCRSVCLPDGDAIDLGNGAVVASQTCVFGGNPWYPRRGGDPLLCGQDETFEDVKIKMGQCVCNDPFIELAGNFFIESVEVTGKILEKVLCPLLKALDIVVAIGMAAIPPPGKAVSAGMMAAARSAKAYKYAYEAQDAAQQWADFFLGGLGFAEKAGCGPLIPTKADLMNKAFGPLSDAADELIPGGMNYDQIPCPPKGCRGCRGPKCRSNDRSQDNNPSRTADSQPNSSNQPAQTTDNQPAQTTNIQPGSTASDQPASTASDQSASTTTNQSGLTTIIQPESTTIIQPESTASDQPAMTTNNSAPDATGSPSKTSDTSTVTSSSSVSPLSTADCKALGEKDKLPEDPETELRRRSYPINLQSLHLEKRAEPKKAQACGFLLESFKYPASGEWTRITSVTPKKYGFNIVNSCDNYDMDSPDASARYATEHVLEWQIVAGFFTKMGDEITAEFDHPDPDKPKIKLKFCDYWKETWSISQRMDNPNPAAAKTPTPTPGPPGSPAATPTPTPGSPAATPTPSPGLPGSPPPTVLEPQRFTPLQWLASQYPYKDEKYGGGSMWLEELTLLEATLNSNNKAKIFTQKRRDSGELYAIRDDTKMKNMIIGKTTEKRFVKSPPEDQARVAVQRLRQMTGTFKYMQDKDVAAIFAKEKNRIGKMIGFIDKELHKTPKIVNAGTTQERTFAPWQEQGLEKRWDKYMDDVFESAKNHATEFMTKNLNWLDEEWDNSKKKDAYKADPKDDSTAKDDKAKKKKAHEDILELIKKTHAEWKKVDDWEKPDNW